MTTETWFTAEMIKGLPGVPQTSNSVSRKATNEDWKRRKKRGVRGVTYEYSFESLPFETQHYLITEENHREWFLAEELTGLSDLPETKSEIIELAKSNCWEVKEDNGVIYYNVTNLNQHAQFALRYNLKKQSLLQQAKDSQYKLQKEDTSEVISDFIIVSGYNMDYENYNENCRVALLVDWLTNRSIDEKDLVAIKATGTSMQPTISPSDIMVIHRGRTKIEDGEMYAFSNNEGLFVRRCQITLSGWKLISDNTAFSPLEVSLTEIDNLKVIGQLVHLSKNLI